MKRKVILVAPGQKNFFDAVRQSEEEYFAYCVKVQQTFIGSTESWTKIIQKQTVQVRETLKEKYRQQQNKKDKQARKEAK